MAIPFYPFAFFAQHSIDYPISNLLMDFCMSGNKNPHRTPPTRNTYVTACQLVALALFTILICKAPAFPTPVTPCQSVFVLIPGLQGNVFHSFVFHNVPPVLENVGVEIG